MNELEINKKINIENMIYEIRGKHVMLASDVAKLYNVETKVLNQSIKRNINRFPESFCFQLTNEEIEILCSRSQIVTLNKSNNLRGYNIKYLPYVLTEQGIMMLSGLLKSDIAVKVNVQIIDAFVKMSKFINNFKEIEYIKSLTIQNANDIKLLQESFNKIEEKQKVNTIFFDGQIYDAYSLLIEILEKSKKEIIIIDNYASKELLNILKDINKKIIIVTSNINEITITKYKKQYNNIEFIENNLFHDRFIILDRKILYNCGSSFKDLGKKCFGIHLIEDKEYLNMILDKIFKY